MCWRASSSAAELQEQAVPQPQQGESAFAAASVIGHAVHPLHSSVVLANSVEGQDEQASLDLQQAVDSQTVSVSESTVAMILTKPATVEGQASPEHDFAGQVSPVHAEARVA